MNKPLELTAEQFAEGVLAGGIPTMYEVIADMPTDVVGPRITQSGLLPYGNGIAALVWDDGLCLVSRLVFSVLLEMKKS